MAIHISKQFIRAIKGNPRNCILFVGAGLSAKGVRKNGAGLPLWRELISAMIDDLKDSGKCDVLTLQEINKYFKANEYLKIAEIYKEKTRYDQYTAFLRELLDPKDLVNSNIHQILLSIEFKGIITTNFDYVFEHNSNRLSPLIYPQAFEDVEKFREHGFFAKIHGCIKHTYNLYDNLVLSEESYLLLRKNPKYQTILKSLFLLNPVLTVGFSLTDPDFLSLFEDLKEIFKTATPTVYSLILTNDEELKTEWRKRGVEIISYQDHEELNYFFSELQKLDNDDKNTKEQTNIQFDKQTNFEPNNFLPGIKKRSENNLGEKQEIQLKEEQEIELKEKRKDEPMRVPESEVKKQRLNFKTKRIIAGAVIFALCLSIGYYSYNKYIATYNAPHIPSFSETLNFFYKGNSKPSGCDSYRFVKRIDGWYVDSLFIDSDSYKIGKRFPIWTMTASSFQNINTWGKRYDGNQVTNENVIGSISDSFMYSFSPTYGYPGWNNDAIKLIEPYYNTLNDTMLYVLARAYESRAFDYIGYENQGFNLIANYKEESLTERKKKFIRDQTSAIEAFKKILSHDPNFQTAVGKINIKYSNECVNSYRLLEIYTYDNSAASSFLRDNLYDSSTFVYYKEKLSTSPSNSLILAYGDNDFYSLLYFQNKYKFRTDIQIISPQLLNDRVYVTYLQSPYLKDRQLAFTLPPDYFDYGLHSRYVKIEQGDTINSSEFLKILKAVPNGKSQFSINAHVFRFSSINSLWDCQKGYVSEADIRLIDILESNSRTVITSQTNTPDSVISFFNSF